MFYTRCVAAVLVGWVLAAPARAVVAGQVDDFEAGTIESWSNGASNPNPATNVGTGGPAGANDNFMRVFANGGTAGGRLVVFNSAQWAGDYFDAGVQAVQMQVNNTGQSDLVLRLIFVGQGQNLTTLSPINVPAGSGWNTVSFSLDPSNLTGGSVDAVLGNVLELNLLHSPNAVLVRTLTPPIVGQLGVDNITAVVPEPGMMSLAVAGFAGLMRRGARRRARS